MIGESALIHEENTLPSLYLPQQTPRKAHRLNMIERSTANAHVCMHACTCMPVHACVYMHACTCICEVNCQRGTQESALSECRYGLVWLRG